MNTTEIIVIILGILASLSLIISSLSTTRTRLLTFSIICSVFAIAQFGLAGAAVAGAVIAVGVVRNSLLLLSIRNERFSWLGHWGVVIFFVVAVGAVWTLMTDWNNFHLLAIVPLAGSVLATVAVFFKNLIYTKSILMVGGVMWFSYNFSVGTYGALLGDVANFVSNGIALTLLISAAMTGKKVIDPTTEVIKTITTAMPVVTTAISTVTSTVTSAIPVITSSVPKIRDNSIKPATDTGE